MGQGRRAEYRRGSGENVHRCAPSRYEVRIRLKGTNPGLSAVIDYVFAARTINRKRETYPRSPPSDLALVKIPNDASASLRTNPTIFPREDGR